MLSENIHKKFPSLCSQHAPQNYDGENGSGEVQNTLFLFLRLEISSLSINYIGLTFI